MQKQLAPNIQQIPVRTPEGTLIRNALVEQSGCKSLLALDYKDLEVRVIAHWQKSCRLAALVD